MNLENYRQEIDAIDHQLLELFCRRMAVAEKIGDYKRQHNLPVFNAAREREILYRIAEEAGEDFGTYARQLYQNIFELSRARQHSLQPDAGNLAEEISAALEKTPKIFPAAASVACQGIEGAYSQLVASRLFPQGRISFFKSWDAVFNAVEKGLCQYGVLPIENSTRGTVLEVYDLMKHHNFQIVRSIKVQVNHVLLARKGASLQSIREIYSHEQALGQCSRFLQAHPEIKTHICENTAVAARMAAESGRDDVAAIASVSCAELYDLKIVAEGIQNAQANFTRFICISKKREIYPGANRISLMLALPHQPGALCQLMSRFVAMGINLLKLESRPIPGRDFEFLFYFDLEGSIYDPQIVKLLSQLNAGPELFVLLGAYCEV
ncbi:MAG: chorismate mutase [Victivallales bacterium]|nr:chorismate mutase [Victivallales bacterium]